MHGFDEILFENRNKDYGAYQLRKYSHKYLVRAVILGYICFLLPIIIMFVVFNADLFLNKDSEKLVSADIIQLSDLRDFNIPPPPTFPPMKKMLPPQTENVVIDSTEEEKPQPKPEQKPILLPVDSLADTKEKGTSPKGNDPTANPDSTYYLTDVDEMPMFVAGELKQFISKNTHYPEAARRARFQGSVIIQFRITKTGDIQDVKIINGVNPLLDREAVRVISGLPRWRPAKRAGRPVSIQSTISVNFKI